MKAAAVALVLLLAGCGGGNDNSGGGSNNSGSGIVVPNVGQWVGSPAYQITQGAQPSWSFGRAVAGYFYTKLPAPPKLGQTLTVNFSVTGSNPVWVQNPGNPTDTNPPTLHVFLWRYGDNLSCSNNVNGQGGFADYRLFSGRTPLVIGDSQTISVPLTTDQWTGCWGKPPLNLQDELNNLMAVGVTFGGQSFAGHGISVSSGSAQFSIRSVGVK